MKRHIPNTITLCNLMCGCIAVRLAFRGQAEAALLFIVLGAVADFFDGFAARRLGVSSPIGKELDSLADLITFGLAPATMVFSLLTTYLHAYAATLSFSLPHSGWQWLNVAAFLVAAFSALRLAKFNLDERQTSSFIGLPTPANALLLASVVITLGNHPEWLTALSSPAVPPALAGIIILCVLIAFSCAMLVCELPLFALKFKHFGWRGNEVRYVFLLTAAAVLIGALAQSRTRFIATIGAVIVWYVVLSLFTARKSAKK